MELNEAALRYESEVSSLGLRFIGEVERVVQLLLEQPEVGARIDESLRHFVQHRFPFSIVYAVTGDLIQVVAVAHGSREPEYWRPRVQDR